MRAGLLIQSSIAFLQGDNQSGSLPRYTSCWMNRPFGLMKSLLKRHQMKSSEGKVVLRVSSVLEDKLPPAATAARCLAGHCSAASLRAEASSLSASWKGGVVLLPILETTCTLSNGSRPSKTLSPSVLLEENKNQKNQKWFQLQPFLICSLASLLHWGGTKQNILQVNLWFSVLAIRNAFLHFMCIWTLEAVV